MGSAFDPTAGAFGVSGHVHHGTGASYVDGLPRGWDPSADTEGQFTEMFTLARRVFEGTACDLPGVGIKYETFIPTMWRAVQAGYDCGAMGGRICRSRASMGF